MYHRLIGNNKQNDGIVRGEHPVRVLGSSQQNASLSTQKLHQRQLFLKPDQQNSIYESLDITKYQYFKNMDDVKDKRIENLLNNQRALQQIIHSQQLEIDQLRSLQIKQDNKVNVNQLLAERINLKKELERKEQQINKMVLENKNTKMEKHKKYIDMLEYEVEVKSNHINKLVDFVSSTIKNKEQQQIFKKAYSDNEGFTEKKKQLRDQLFHDDSNISSISMASHHMFENQPTIKINSLNSVKQEILSLNKIKETLVEQIKRKKNVASGMAPEMEAEYQTVYYNILTNIENIKQQSLLKSIQYDHGEVEDNEKLRKQNDKVKNQNEEIKRQLQTCQLEINHNKEKINTIKGLQAQLRNQNSQLKCQLQELQKKIEEQSRKIKRQSEKHVKDIEQYRKSVSEEILQNRKQFETQTNKYEQQIQAYQQRIEILSNELKRATQMDQEINMYKEELRIAKNQLIQMEKALIPILPKQPIIGRSEDTSKMKLLISENENYRKLIKKMEGEAFELNQQYEEIIKNLEAENKKLSREYLKLKETKLNGSEQILKQKQEFITTIKNLMEELQKKNKQNTQLKQDAANLILPRNSHSKTPIDIPQLFNRVKMAESKVLTRNKQIEHLWEIKKVEYLNVKDLLNRISNLD